MTPEVNPQKELARKRKEMISLFADPRFSRQAWQSVGRAIAAKPACPPIAQFDKEGNLTYNSTVEKYGYEMLARDVDILASDNPAPTQLEMIIACQMIKARTDTAAATFIRDTLGAKPVDESKIEQRNINTYETLTDEELELLQQHRKMHEIQEADGVASPQNAITPAPVPAGELANCNKEE